MATDRRTLRADAARNYQRIVGVAVTAFEELGPEVTLEEIARRADVSVMTVYRRFRARDQLVRAVLDHVLTTEVQPMTAAHTDDPWRDLVNVLEASIDVLARRQVILSIARESDAFDVEGVRHYLSSLERLLRRAVEAGVVRPELEVRDLAAVIVMVLATVRPSDPDGADRRRNLALVVEGLRVSPTTLPPSSRQAPGATVCEQ
ncbi:TetR/AcrR family transcriptional regulator [Streptomyces caniscabiei]|nr:TetR/AcrR family transcriptional regulator [Streptomyces caniscabiei]MDX3510843.1 TetR/AcrR family transcriptional regulator [Streptomyces caniscabiei]MDX3720214.1 TetR/AcrR family transcriptional regulator [Streptomyces caniscabiei]MDX3729379.1 TetR/AcrR family transcriptional regulator [Streptomyces caniscabiei]WEO29317.1 TetR/AcrR family transcriptional regulator [Streptomyces caniscabiei]